MTPHNKETQANLLEETELRLLCLVDLFPDGVSSNGYITSLALNSNFAGLSNKLGNLVFLIDVELALEFIGLRD